MNRGRGDGNPDWGILPEESLVPVELPAPGERTPPQGEEIEGGKTLPPDDHAPTEPPPRDDQEDGAGDLREEGDLRVGDGREGVIAPGVAGAVEEDELEPVAESQRLTR
jgi:hypothetical protein